MEPFYFKSYDRVVGVAHNIVELKNEIERLSKLDSACVEWHLKEGHIVAWLEYINEKGLAEILKGVGDPNEALSRISDYIMIKNSLNIIGRPYKKSKRKVKKSNI
ncbi:MAG: hypothetical protein OWQ54_05585 [Sulfolobaceae archaeon]|nr:hypothetical protein [Sulfolobaceae archaeon]